MSKVLPVDVIPPDSPLFMIRCRNPVSQEHGAASVYAACIAADVGGKRGLAFGVTSCDDADIESTQVQIGVIAANFMVPGPFDIFAAARFITIYSHLKPEHREHRWLVGLWDLCAYVDPPRDAVACSRIRMNVPSDILEAALDGTLENVDGLITTCYRSDITLPMHVFERELIGGRIERTVLLQCLGLREKDDLVKEDRERQQRVNTFTEVLDAYFSQHRTTSPMEDKRKESCYREGIRAIQHGGDLEIVLMRSLVTCLISTTLCSTSHKPGEEGLIAEAITIGIHEAAAFLVTMLGGTTDKYTAHIGVDDMSNLKEEMREILLANRF